MKYFENTTAKITVITANENNNYLIITNEQFIRGYNVSINYERQGNKRRKQFNKMASEFRSKM